MRSSWLYLARRSERHGAPVLIWLGLGLGLGVGLGLGLGLAGGARLDLARARGWQVSHASR